MAEQPLGSTYTLMDKLGAGAMGTVYRGRDTRGTAYAFKLLRPEFAEDPALVQRFVQERSALVGVQHPNVVVMRDLVIEGVTLAIVMDLVEGGDLRRVLDERGTLPPAEAARFAGGIAAGLAAVHAAGLVHRDVKPENVLLDFHQAAPVPKVSDFGIARLADAAASTRSTMMLGTPNYVAPEVADGRPATGAADVYSLGIMLYEMCAGVTPFEGGSQLAVIRRHGDATASRPDGVPDPLWAAIRDMLAKDPNQRPTAAQAAPYLSNLATALEGSPAAPALSEPLPIGSMVTQVAAASPIVEVEDVEEEEAESPRLRRPLVILGVLAVVLVLLGGVFVAMQFGGQRDDAASSANDAVVDASAAPTTAPPSLSETTESASPTPTRSSSVPATPTPEPATMPNVVGQTLSAARSELSGVAIEVVEEFDGAAKDNEVLAQSVEEGEELPDTVQLTVAKQPVTVYLDTLTAVENSSVQDGIAELNGEKYPRSLISDYRSGYREVNLSRGYRQLVATVGRSDNAQDAEEEVQVEVFLDQRKVWSERVVLGETIDMDIDVTDALRLRIEFTSLNQKYAYLALGDIQLRGLPGEVPEPEDE